jgi:hypothetical protein
MAKKVDPKAKAKRQKVIAAAGGVLLLGLLAFQVPRTMKMLHQQGAGTDSTAASTSATPTATTPLAPPSLDGARSTGGSSATAGSLATDSTSKDGVVDPDAPLPPAAGQLVGFGRFRSKDPFAQQLSPACAGGGDVDAAGSCPVTSSSTGKRTAKAKAGAAVASEIVPLRRTAVPKATPATTAKRVRTATISVNGVTEHVSTGRAFPSSDPVFVLVALSPRAAKIGISGGSLENGAATVTLVKGSALTLMNTADGTRYVLRLLATR